MTAWTVFKIGVHLKFRCNFSSHSWKLTAQNCTLGYESNKIQSENSTWLDTQS